MRDKFRKLTSMVAAATLCAAAISFAGCADSYSIKALPGNIQGEVSSNGGFVVEKGDYIPSTARRIIRRPTNSATS
ncbi:MAG: hypothetical protein ACLR3U_08205 [Christensenellaceae bacterium]